MSALHLRNPHSVLAAIATRPRDVSAVRVNPQSGDSAWRDVMATAAEFGVRVESRPPRELGSRRHADQEGRQGAGEGVVQPKADLPLDELFANTGESGLWLAFDHLQDPHNVGAVFRTAAFFGVRGIVLTKDRSAPLSATVYDIASGGVEYVPFSLQANLSRALRVAKDTGLWVLGTSEHAEKDVVDIPRDRPWLLVLGNEQKGLRQLTTRNCDDVCRLTPCGGVTSLNVSVAAGILIAALTGSGAR
ncbi:MAG: RNA methyltransferase [Planctomycetaceae bacterium]|nr:RNA methyltransferase [Planctomycetaceae bacterium]